MTDPTPEEVEENDDGLEDGEDNVPAGDNAPGQDAPVDEPTEG